MTTSSDTEKEFRDVDAFLLGYLPHRVGAHFLALKALLHAQTGAAGELASRVEAGLRSLPERGPEVVSCVWQIESILGERLRAQLPEPPRSAEEFADFSRAVGEAFEGACRADAGGWRTAYALGNRVGAAEHMAATAALYWSLWAAARGDARMEGRGGVIREELASLASSPDVTSDCPTVRGEGSDITRALSAAVEAAARAPDDSAADELAKIQAQLGECARALESAVRGTPRDSVRAWRDKRMSGGELMRRLCEHYRWSAPCLFGEDGQPRPRFFVFDKRVFLVFGDSRARDEQPAFVHTGSTVDQLYLTFRGVALFRWLPEADVDVITIDPTDDPDAPQTINYPREMHARLRQVANEVALDLAACDWSRLDLEALRAYSFWVLVSGGQIHNLLARDGRGRPFVGLFSSEEALDAHLALATPEQARDHAQWQKMLLQGAVMFPSLARLDVAGVMLNPSGPGRTRSFNTRTLEMLASG
ncbi:MAG: hypothetical protein JOZ02_04235 [Acidobacteria bacterium]|nr:hypothetical protein [Acidobacteriota bacterium]